MALPLPEGEDVASSWNCNFIVMSNAGKPIYANWGDDSEISRVCGLVQAVRSTIGSLTSLEGDIRSLQSGKLCIVFLPVGALSLVAIGNVDTHESYLKLQLEYILLYILFTLTERVQDYFVFDPGFDLRSILGAADAGVIHGILDESSPAGNPAPFMLGSVETLFPISPAIRARASRALQAICLKTEFTAFAMMTAGDKLITLIQPGSAEYQMRMADLHLLLKAVNRQPHLSSSELWIPVCLPLFSSRDFLYCYTQCWDEDSKLCLILVSQQGTTQQFQLFQAAAASIRRSLDLPATAQSSILEILDSNGCSSHNRAEDENSDSNTSYLNDVKWRRSEEDKGFDQDYVEVSYGDLDAMLPYLPSPPRVSSSVFLHEVTAACSSKRMQGHIDHYLAIGSALHFLFRMDAGLLTAPGDRDAKLSQCVASPMKFPFLEDASRRRVWSTYQKLRLRLCLGSATTVSTLNGWDELPPNEQLNANAQTVPTDNSTNHFSAMAFASGSTNGGETLAFVVDKSELYIAMKGNDYEL